MITRLRPGARRAVPLCIVIPSTSTRRRPGSRTADWSLTPTRQVFWFILGGLTGVAFTHVDRDAQIEA